MSDFFNGWPEDGEPMTDDTQRLIERLDAASRDDRLADGMLYREAKDALEAMQTRVAELDGALQEIADSELSSGGQLRMMARQALALKEQDDA